MPDEPEIETEVEEPKPKSPAKRKTSGDDVSEAAVRERKIKSIEDKLDKMLAENLEFKGLFADFLKTKTEPAAKPKGDGTFLGWLREIGFIE